MFDQFNTVVRDSPHASSTSSSPLSARYTAAPSVASTSRRDVTSHSASVCHLAFTPSSCQLVSLGTDSRLRVWDPFSGRHLLVHFPHLQCRYRYSRFDVQHAAGVGQLGECIWLGSGRDVREVAITGGAGMRHVAHFDRVNVVATNSRWDEVYSAGADRSILTWQRQCTSDENEREDGEMPLHAPSADPGRQSAAEADAEDWELEDGAETAMLR